MCEHVFVRWDNLSVDAEESKHLPGYKEPAAIRTFDAPEALDTRFYEVRAKSVLNHVPKMSRVPFEWTINPYRGCSHACRYCLSGDSPILMADGRTRPLEDLRPGDRIYGTERRGTYRHYVLTDVLDHWQTLKPAYRVVLEDGTELIASGDHRFLSNRGWKHVTGAEQGTLQRPHLTTNNKLIGTGGFAAPPGHSTDYRRGYLCGMVRGDGTLRSYAYERPGRRDGDVHRFRLALTDLEPLQRSRQFLSEFEVATDAFAYKAATADHRALTAIRTQSRGNVVAIRLLIEWPRDASIDWCKGFLAGIFDAEGSHSGVIRICNTDPVIIDWTLYCLRRLGFDTCVEDLGRANGLQVVRVRGGLPENLRFFHTVDPATTRKRTIDGVALKCASKTRVTAIEPLGVDLPLYDITSGTGDFIANGVVSHNCFARPTHEFLDFNAGRDFEREIVVKVNAPEVARAELMRPRWKRQHVAIGTNTDPYQWVESKYRLMPGIWEALRDSDTPCSLLTKSPLMLRDIELFKELHERVGFVANFSVPTLEEKAWRETEPHTPHPRKRLEAVAKLTEAGIPCGVLVAPLMPGINDEPEQVEEIVRIAEEAGATSIGGIHLHLRPGVKEVFMEWLRANRPDLVPLYERLYAGRAYAPKAEQKRITSLVKPTRPPRGPRMRGVQRTPPRQQAEREPEPTQGSLF
jgi:DNA repair photolyase